MPLRVIKLRRRAMSGDEAAPISTGPPPPVLYYLILLPVRVAGGDPDRAREHHVDAGADLAGLEHPLAIGEAARPAEALNVRNLVRREHRKQLRAARLERRGKRSGHARPPPWRR